MFINFQIIANHSHRRSLAQRARSLRNFMASIDFIKNRACRSLMCVEND